MFGSTSNEATEDFQSMLYSLQAPETDTQSRQNISGPTLLELLLNNGLHPLTFLLNLLLTFSAYTLPILIYRFALHSGPLEKKRAKKIVIIYGICAYLLMCLIAALLHGNAGIAIFFWSYVNYRILISGKRPEPKPADTPAERTDRLPPAALDAPAPYTPAQSASQTSPVAPSVPATSARAAYIPAAPTPASSAPQTPPAPRIQFCRNCGFRLLDGSRFCSACGTPVVSIPKE